MTCRYFLRNLSRPGPWGPRRLGLAPLAPVCPGARRGAPRRREAAQAAGFGWAGLLGVFFRLFGTEKGTLKKYTAPVGLSRAKAPNLVETKGLEQPTGTVRRGSLEGVSRLNVSFGMDLSTLQGGEYGSQKRLNACRAIL